jgi:hypothetical protein
MLAFIAIYRYAVFFPHLMDGPDWQFPLASSIVAWNNLFSAWDLIGIGAPSRFGVGFTIYNYVFRGFICMLAFGDMLIQQKIWFTAFFVASVGMYILSINHLTRVKLAALTAALIYGYSPLMTVNFGTGNIWQIAFLPYTFNCILNICSRRRGRDILLLSIFMTLQFSFGLHTLVLLPVMILIIWASYFLQAREKLDFVKSTFTRLSIALCLFIAMNPNLVFLGLEVYGITHSYDPQAFIYGVPEVSMQSIIHTFQSMRPLTSFFTMSSYLHEDLNINIPFLGIVIPVVGFASLIHIKGPKKPLAFSLATCIIINALFVLSVVNASPIYAWLFEHFPPIREMNGPFAPTVYLSLFMSSLIALSLGQIATVTHRRPFKGKPKDYKIRMALGIRAHALGKHTCLILCFLVLSSFFAFNPAFTLRSQVLGEGYHESDALVPYPSVYSELTPYLGNAGQPSDFRYLIIPSTFTSRNSLPRNYPNTPICPNSGQALSYTSLLGTSLIAEERGWGSLLDIANIRYIIIINNTYEPTLYRYRVQGPPRYIPEGDVYYGKPADFERIVAQESHLHLIRKGKDFWVYENPNYVPHIAAFGRLTYVFGSISDLTKISSIPGYTLGDSVMIFSKNYTYTLSMIKRANTVVFINLKPIDMKRESIYNRLITEILGKNILYYQENLGATIEQGVSFYLPKSTRYTVAIGNINARNLVLRPDAFNFKVNGVPVRPDGLDIEGGWLFLHVQLPAGEHKLNVEAPYGSNIDRMIIYTGENISDLFGQTRSVTYSVLRSSPEEYVVKVDSSSPYYLVLGESYHPNWRAYIDKMELQHFEAFSLSNGFVVDEGGSHVIHIKYVDPTYKVMLSIGLGTFISTVVVLVSLVLLNKVVGIRCEIVSRTPYIVFYRVSNGKKLYDSKLAKKYP